MNMTLHFGKLGGTLAWGQKSIVSISFLLVISAEFIICFFALGIAVEKWYQMCLLNFKRSLIAKEIRVYPLLLSK